MLPSSRTSAPNGMQWLCFMPSVLTDLIWLALHQQRQRTGLQRVRCAGFVLRPRTAGGLAGSVDQRHPTHSGSSNRQLKRNLFMMSVHHQQKIFVGYTLAAIVDLVHRRSREKNAQRFGVLLVPLFVRHFASVGAEPQNVFHSCALDCAPLEEVPSAKDGMIFAER